MEFTYNETVSKKVQLQFPSFVRFSENYYKILDKENVIIVVDYSFCKKIEVSIMAHSNPFGNDGWEFISADIFNDAYARVFEKLVSITEQAKELIQS